MDKFNEVTDSLIDYIGNILKKVPNNLKPSVYEIRIRINKPIQLICDSTTYFVKETGYVTSNINDTNLIIYDNILNDLFDKICNYSLYSCQEELKDGYITIKGGHRIGVCGTTIVKNGCVEGIKHVSSLNIRISRNIKSVSKKIFDTLGNKILSGMLIVGPPCSGKTTLLRDLAYNLSIGKYLKPAKKVTVVDERNEISGNYSGSNLYDLGLSDVLCKCPKKYGIITALRAMSPEIIICDEIGDQDDAIGLTYGINAGVSIISSMHANSFEELKNRPQAIKILKTKAFNIVLLLSQYGKCQVNNILNLNEVCI